MRTRAVGGRWMGAASLIVAMVAGGRWAQTAPAAEDAEDRLGRIEADVTRLSAENARLAAALNAGTGTASFARAAGIEPAPVVGGFLQMQADGGDRGDARYGSDRGRFYLRRARLNLSGKREAGFDFRIEAELAGTLSESSDLRAQLTDGYVTWKAHPAAALRIGQFKTAYSHEQIVSDCTLYAIERTLAVDRLALFRQVGAQVSGAVLGGHLAYAAGAFNGTGANSSFNDDGSLLWVGRLGVAPWTEKGSSLAFAVNGFASDDRLRNQPAEFGFHSKGGTNQADNVFDGARRGAGIDAQWRQGPFELWAEYLATRYEADNAVPSDAVDAGGGYVQASFFLVPDRWQGVLRYDTFDPDDRRQNVATDAWTIGINRYVRGHDLKLQVNYQLLDLEDRDARESKLLARLQVMF